MPLATTPLPQWELYCDGSALPNPGRMGLGGVLIGPDGVVRHRLSIATTDIGCNNEAELQALLQCLQWLSKQVPAAGIALRVFSDSRVLVDQLSTPAALPIARLAPLFDQAYRALQRFAQVELQWIPRARNGAADALSRSALGLAAKVCAPRSKQRRKHR